MQITEQQQRNLQDFLARVDTRTEPLGVGLKNQCFVGLAVEQASDHNQTMADFFGLSSRTWKNAVKENNRQPEATRNQHMRAYGRQHLLA